LGPSLQVEEVNEKFYHMRWPDADKVDSAEYGMGKWESTFPAAEWDDNVEIESVACPIIPGHARAGTRIGDLRIVLTSPRIGDFVWTWQSECLITEGVRQLFEGTGVSGYDLSPVTVTKVKRKPHDTGPHLPALWEVVVTGRGGDALVESGVRVIYRHEPCKLVRYSSFTNGLLVDRNLWDGSDFFTVNGYPKMMLVSERVKEVIVANALENCMLIEASKMTWGSVSRPEDIDWLGIEREATNGAR